MSHKVAAEVMTYVYKISEIRSLTTLPLHWSATVGQRWSSAQLWCHTSQPQHRPYGRIVWWCFDTCRRSRKTVVTGNKQMPEMTFYIYSLKHKNLILRWIYLFEQFVADSCIMTLNNKHNKVESLNFGNFLEIQLDEGPLFHAAGPHLSCPAVSHICSATWLLSTDNVFTL